MTAATTGSTEAMMDARCCCPPESCVGKALIFASRPTILSSFCAFSLTTSRLSKENVELADGDIIALELDGAMVLKRLRFRGSDVVLKAENTEYDDIRMTKEQFAGVKILGKCVGFQSKWE
jgi:hypothetical protein